VDEGQKIWGRTLNGLGVDILAIEIELVEEDCDNVWRSRERDCEGVLGGSAIFVRQSSMSPVAPECTIEDDSNGSIARDRFNLMIPC